MGARTKSTNKFRRVVQYLTETTLRLDLQDINFNSIDGVTHGPTCIFQVFAIVHRTQLTVGRLIEGWRWSPRRKEG